MEKHYQVKIEEDILQDYFTYEELIRNGLLDERDENILVKLVGDREWVVAKDYPFPANEDESQHSWNNASELSVCPNDATQDNRSSVSRNNMPDGFQEDHSQTVQRMKKREPSFFNNWNWGAFCFSWIWGIFNGIYWPLIIIVLNFIPYIGIVLSLSICIFLGIKGNKLAWKAWTASSDSDVNKECFKNVQKKWNDAGILLIVFSTFAFLLYTAISLV